MKCGSTLLTPDKLKMVRGEGCSLTFSSEQMKTSRGKALKQDNKHYFIFVLLFLVKGHPKRCPFYFPKIKYTLMYLCLGFCFCQLKLSIH